MCVIGCITSCSHYETINRSPLLSNTICSALLQHLIYQKLLPINICTIALLSIVLQSKACSTRLTEQFAFLTKTYHMFCAICLANKKLGKGYFIQVNQGAISLKLLGGKLAPKVVYFVLRKELLKF